MDWIIYKKFFFTLAFCLNLQIPSTSHSPKKLFLSLFLATTEKKFKYILLFLFLLVFISSCSANEPSRYNELDFFDLVAGKEDDIHANRVTVLNSKIDNTNKEINLYKKKIRLTRQAINDLKIEVNSYNALINNVSNDIQTVNQLNGFLDNLDSQIKNVELEFSRVKNISKGLEKISKSEFLSFKSKGYFSDLNWLDYLEIVQEVIEYKQEIDNQIKSSRANIKYVRSHPTKVVEKVVKWGVKKVLRRLIPPLAILDGIETLSSVVNYFWKKFFSNLKKEILNV